MFKTISLIAAKRVDYLNRILEGLKANDLSEYKLFIGLEPVSNEVRAVCEGIDFIETEIVYNPEVLGLNKNPYHLLEYVFQQGSELNYYLEDDVLPSPDMTQLADWYGAQEWPDDVLCLSGFQMYSDPRRPDEMIWTPHFHSWAAVFTPGQWERHLEPNWFNNPPTHSWDVNILEYGLKEGLKVLQPMYTRCKHVGLHGTNVKELNPSLVHIAEMLINEEKRAFDYTIVEPVEFFVKLTAAPDKGEELGSLLEGLVELTRCMDGCRQSRLLKHPDKETEFLWAQEWEFIGSFYRQLDPRSNPEVATLQTLSNAPPEILFSTPAELDLYAEPA